jgi:tight adherence protein B
VIIPAAALWYGLAIGTAGLFVVAAINIAERERMIRRVAPIAPTGGAVTHRKVGGRGRLDGRIRSRGWPWSFRSYAAAHGSGLVIGLPLGYRFAGPVGAFGAAVGTSLVLESWLSRRRAKVREQADDQFRDVLTALAAATRAGLSLRRGLTEAARDAEPPIRGTLQEALRRIEVGEPIEEALEDLASGSSDARLVTTLIAVHRRTGGDLPSMLDEVADIVGRRTETRRQARALSAQARASGAVLAILPVAFVGLLSGTSGSGLGAFYRTATGSMLLLVGLVLQGVGFFWLRRIARAGGAA